MIPAREKKRRPVKRKPKLRRCPFTGKVKFPTQAAASEAVGRALVSTEQKRNERRSYKCDKCECWHLTSQEKRDADDYSEWT